MKLIIAGSRTMKFEHMKIDMFLSFLGVRTYDISQVVSGGALGVDKSGENFANIYLSDKPDYLKIFVADWDKYGNRAGPIRNSKMAVYADALLLIWDGKSTGSAHMRSEMVRLGKPIYEVVIRRVNEN